MSHMPIENQQQHQLDFGKLTLDNFLEEFNRVEVERLLYTLSSLYDIGEEVTSSESPELRISMGNLLRMLMGTVLCTKAAVLSYAKYKYAMQSIVAKGIDANFYLRLDPKELSRWMELRQPLTLAEVESELPAFFKAHQESLLRYQIQMMVPMVVKDNLVGCILLGDKLDKTTYSATDQILLTMIARQVSMDIYKFSLIEELKQTSDKLRKQKAELVEANLGVQKMSEISMRFISILEENKLFQSILEEMLSSTSATKGVIFKVDHGRDALTMMCCKNTEPFSQRNLLPYRSYEALARTIESGDPHICMVDGGRMWQVEAKYALFVPIHNKNRDDESALVSYVMAVFDKEKRGGGVLTFNERDEAILVSFANYASILIENVRNYELATKDSMTGLYVRRFFDQRLVEQIDKANQVNKVFSLLIMDIDKFKHVNDTFGHPIGDQVIKLVATTIQRNIRTEVDIPSRYGGEEFTILMPEADTERALMVAERIRQAVEVTDVSHLVTGRNITVSIGIATFPAHGSTPKQLMEASDVALYRSKGGGRNRVSIYEDEV
ncbi:MAG: GGDEF domain-containing protein [Candidatus Sericytochromatia bacterium]|jgi:diguanylate cyclase (GGDEF)-like protein|nr:GGDEF domain-containing protein [Candidatus Sericytochromatia bacterium]